MDRLLHTFRSVTTVTSGVAASRVRDARRPAVSARPPSSSPISRARLSAGIARDKLGVLSVESEAKQKQEASGHWNSVPLHTLLHVAVLTSTAMLTHSSEGVGGTTASEGTML